MVILIQIDLRAIYEQNSKTIKNQPNILQFFKCCTLFNVPKKIPWQNYGPKVVLRII